MITFQKRVQKLLAIYGDVKETKRQYTIDKFHKTGERYSEYFKERMAEIVIKENLLKVYFGSIIKRGTCMLFALSYQELCKINKDFSWEQLIESILKKHGLVMLQNEISGNKAKYYIADAENIKTKI